jgi:hypothetical protein
MKYTMQFILLKKGNKDLYLILKNSHKYSWNSFKNDEKYQIRTCNATPLIFI